MYENTILKRNNVYKNAYKRRKNLIMTLLRVKYLLLCGIKSSSVLFYENTFLKKMNIREIYQQLSVITDRI